MNKLLLHLTAALFACMALNAEPELPPTTPPIKAEKAATIHGTWILRDVEAREGIRPDLRMSEDGRFAMTAGDGQQVHGTYKLAEKDGKKLLTLTYTEPTESRIFILKSLTPTQLVLESQSTGESTTYDKREQRSIPNPLVPN